MQTVQQAVKHASGLGQRRHFVALGVSEGNSTLRVKPIAGTIRLPTGPYVAAPGRRSCCLATKGYPPPGLPGGDCEASLATALFNVQHALNNPITLYDPSGHIACSDLGGETCDPDNPDDFDGYTPGYYDQGTTITISILNSRVKEKIRDFLEATYNWVLTEADWTLQELRSISQAGREISSYVTDVIGSDGAAWIRQNLSATLRRLALPIDSFVVGSNMYLTAASLARSDAVFVVVHEFGHIFDNHSGGPCPGSICGGGFSDTLIKNLGGEPGSSWLGRARDGASLNLDPIYHLPSYEGYAQKGTSEYFAQLFALSIMRPDEIRTFRQKYLMNSFIRQGTP